MTLFMVVSLLGTIMDDQTARVTTRRGGEAAAVAIAAEAGDVIPARPAQTDAGVTDPKAAREILQPLA